MFATVLVDTTETRAGGLQRSAFLRRSIIIEVQDYSCRSIAAPMVSAQRVQSQVERREVASRRLQPMVLNNE